MGNYCFTGDDHETDTSASANLLPRVQHERVPPPGAPVDKKWYHRGISHEEAEYRLRSISNDNGVYLVYDNPKSQGNYILLAIYNGDCVRWDINRKSDGTYILGKDGPRVKSHESVRKLIKYHRGVLGKPIKMQDGRTLRLNDYIYEASQSFSSSRSRSYPT